MRVVSRQSGTGFPPLVWGVLGLLSLFFLGAALLTSTRIVVFGRNADATIVALKPGSRRITDVTVAYATETGEQVRSSRGGFTSNELYALALELGRHQEQEGEGFDAKRLLGAKVPVRYLPARPTLAHIARWVPLYRELVASHAAWMVCAGAAALSYRFRRRG